MFVCGFMHNRRFRDSGSRANWTGAANTEMGNRGLKQKKRYVSCPTFKKMPFWRDLFLRQCQIWESQITITPCFSLPTPCHDFPNTSLKNLECTSSPKNLTEVARLHPPLPFLSMLHYFCSKAGPWQNAISFQQQYCEKRSSRKSLC